MRHTSSILGLVVAAATLFSPVNSWAYSSGAPGCVYPGGSMAANDQSGTGGYTLTTSGALVAGGSITVTLSGPSFRGFVVEAVRANPGSYGDTSFGQFTPLPSGTAGMNCGTPAGAVTHNQSSSVTSKQFTWRAPNDTTMTAVTFHAIVVRDINTWYGRSASIRATVTATPVDCAVGAFSDFGACSASCGTGTQTRSRTVTTPAAYGGAACPALTESRSCEGPPCPVDCQVSAFGDFGACSVTCGGGTRSRSRTITVQPANGGAACPALTQTEACNTQACPVDCVVGDFSAFGACSVTCGDGTRTRTRPILVQPANGGAACPALSETVSCSGPPCPVDCQVSAYGQFSTCSATCGGGTQTRTRTITVTPANGGAACPALSETISCNTQACPVDCLVSDWSAFSDCTATTCDTQGTRTRTRTVTRAAANGGAACPALSETIACAGPACPTDCVVSEFGPFSQCSVACGGGTQVRSRSILVPAANGGAACPALTESAACNTFPCNRDCVTSAFSEFSECSAACGGGTRSRSRTVLVEQTPGGAACGALVETEACNTAPCPVDCVVGDFGAFSDCSATCGGGLRTRSRPVLVQPVGTGAACPALVETEACNTEACPVDCLVGDFGAFSECSAECGTGVRTRSRPILREPANGGAECPPTIETESCVAGECPPDCDSGLEIKVNGVTTAEGATLNLCDARLELPGGAAATGTGVRLLRLDALRHPDTTWTIEPFSLEFLEDATLVLPLHTYPSNEVPVVEHCPDLESSEDPCPLLEVDVDEETNTLAAAVSGGGVFRRTSRAVVVETPDAGAPKPDAGNTGADAGTSDGGDVTVEPPPGCAGCDSTAGLATFPLLLLARRHRR